MDIEYITFPERRARAEYMAKRFRHYLKGKILDVGCDKAYLKGFLQGVEYTGIDIMGNPDIRLNLEEVDALPFDDAVFDCVVCADVLEHLDNLHFIVDEIIRVSKRYIIISMPNNWANARRAIARGKGSIGHYGLPEEPPLDRHKWFFSLSEAIDFFRKQAKKKNFLLLRCLQMRNQGPYLSDCCEGHFIPLKYAILIAMPILYGSL